MHHKWHEERVDGIDDVDSKGLFPETMLQCCVSSCLVDVGDVVPSPGNLSLGEHGSSKDGPYLWTGSPSFSAGVASLSSRLSLSSFKSPILKDEIVYPAITQNHIVSQLEGGLGILADFQLATMLIVTGCCHEMQTFEKGFRPPGEQEHQPRLAWSPYPALAPGEFLSSHFSLQFQNVSCLNTFEQLC